MCGADLHLSTYWAKKPNFFTLGLVLEHEASNWASTQISPLPPTHDNAYTISQSSKNASREPYHVSLLC